MKRMIPIVLSALAVSVSAFAQAPADPNASVLAAAPANMREGATIVKWKPDFTYDTVKKGTNRLVCYDRSGFPGQLPFSIECTSIANLDRVAQNMKFEAAGDKTKTQALIDVAEKDGTRVKPEYGSVWYHLMPGSPPDAYDHRRAWCDDPINRPARQQQAGRRVDHERGHDDRPHHDTGRMTSRMK
jgi:hypothetical protein